MKSFNRIVMSDIEPQKDCLWIKDNAFYIFGSNGWKKVNDYTEIINKIKEGLNKCEDIDSINNEIDSINNDIKSIKSDISALKEEVRQIQSTMP